MEDAETYRRVANNNNTVQKTPMLEEWRNAGSSGSSESITLNSPMILQRGKRVPIITHNNDYVYKDKHLQQRTPLLGSIEPSPKMSDVAVLHFRNTLSRTKEKSRG